LRYTTTQDMNLHNNEKFDILSKYTCIYNILLYKIV